MENLLASLGLSESEADIFLKLLELGESTVLQVSRAVGVNRTTAYRVLEELEKKGFVVKNPKTKTTHYSASSLDFIESKLREEKDRVLKAEEEYKNALPNLTELIRQRSNKIDVAFYTGSEEIKQLIWNSLKAKDEIRSFGYRSLKEAVGVKFVVKWWNESILRRMKHMMIANPATYKMKAEADSDSSEKFISPQDPDFWETRYFEEDELPIKMETFIYNDVYAIVQWGKDLVFGVEVHNKFVAEQEKKVFDFLWSKAKVWNDKAPGET